MREFGKQQLIKAAKRVLARENPHVIAVTGSVGKSSAKEAIKAVLQGNMSLRVSPKNYNTDVSIPLTILGLSGGKKSSVQWVSTVMTGVLRSLRKDPNYPHMLLLEMGADRKGDIKKLAKIAPPKIAVVTSVGESHGEYLGSPDDIAKEKRALVEALDKDGIAVLCRDDARVWAMREKCKGRVVSFGFHEEADVRADQLSMNPTCDPKGNCGMSFKMTAKGSTVPLFLPYVLGKHAAYAALAAAAVGTELDMNMVEVADGLRNYEAPPGRMRFVPGIKNTVLIDDTYNAAPNSMAAAINALGEMPVTETTIRFAVLGDMLELGEKSVEQHQMIGRKVAIDGIDMLICVGELMGEAKKAALEAGMPEDHVFHFSTAAEAGRFVQGRLKQGDVVLAKGSQSMRMEYVIKELMAEPLRAAELLPRQHDEWKIN